MDASDLSDEGLTRLASRLGGTQREAVRTLFVMSLQAKHPLHFLDPKTHTLSVPDYSDETLAVWSAAAPWMLLAKKGASADSKRVHSDERDPAPQDPAPGDHGPRRADRRAGGGRRRRSLLRASRRCRRAIRSTLSSFPKGEDFAVFVGNERGEPILPGSGPMPKQQAMVSRRLTAPFSDWWIAVQDRRSSAERWARRNFALNMSLSLALALLLLGAILLTTRSAAREMRLSAMKSDFVSNVSHELRTPLASIRVFGELMRTGRVESPEKTREYGERIEAEALRLGQLVENILDFSRIESGRKVYRFEERGLRARSSAAWWRASPPASAAAASASSCRRPEAPLPRMSVDAQAIDQALCNVLENAVKYSGEARDVVVRLARRGAEVVVSVSDQGIGIPRDEQDRIFERFHRVGTGLVHEVRGAGLGLAIVRHIVLAHGGRVEVQSAPGRGQHLLDRAARSGEPQPRAAATAAGARGGEAG